MTQPKDMLYLSESHVAFLNGEGDLTIHARPSESTTLDSREALLLDYLLTRNTAWLQEKSGGPPLRSEIHIWTPDQACWMFFQSQNIDLEQSHTWGQIINRPGMLFLLPEHEAWEATYGGLTRSGQEFILVPATHIYMRETELIVRSAWEHFELVAFKSEREKMFYIARLIDDENWDQPLKEGSKRHARQTLFWRDLAGDKPIPYDTYDLRQ